MSHPDADVLREVLTWLELPAEALHTDATHSYAAGSVALRQLWAWRKELRTSRHLRSAPGRGTVAGRGGTGPHRSHGPGLISTKHEEAPEPPAQFRGLFV